MLCAFCALSAPTVVETGSNQEDHHGEGEVQKSPRCEDRRGVTQKCPAVCKTMLVEGVKFRNDQIYINGSPDRAPTHVV